MVATTTKTNQDVAASLDNRNKNETAAALNDEDVNYQNNNDYDNGDYNK